MTASLQPFSSSLTAETISYRLHRPRPGTVRLWTLQPKAVLESLCQRGRLYVDLTQIEGPDFADYPWAYDYMREQMAQRLPDYQGHYPWWARQRPKPDLRRWHHRNCFPPGTRAVRMELAIAAQRVLLSNQAAWWCVIAGHTVTRAAADYELPEFQSEEQERAALTERGTDRMQWPLSEPWQFSVVPSWERVFDLQATREEWGMISKLPSSGWSGATLWRSRSSQPEWFSGREA